jgi:uncharacterized membrane protein (UPF0127 family)
MFTLANAATGSVIAQQLSRPTGWLRRTIGLLGRDGLEAGEGLWLERCWGVHTVGMRFSLDILFLDAEFRIVAFERNVRPGRLAVVYASSYHVIELPAGTLDPLDLLIGDRLRMFDA